MSEKKILVVDDEEPTRDVFEQAFRKVGYTVHPAKSGEEALKILKDENIQVMFLDLNMPDMNGLELCQEIRKDSPMAIIHAVTGYASLFELSDCRDAGFDDYFDKPINLEQLYKAAQSAFDRLDRWKKTKTLNKPILNYHRCSPGNQRFPPGAISPAFDPYCKKSLLSWQQSFRIPKTFS